MTVAFRVVDWAEVMEVGLALSVVVLLKAVFHLAIRFVTFTEPSPVAISYCAPAAYASMKVEVFVAEVMTPKLAPGLVKQLGVPAWHSLLLPLVVTSLNTQVEAGSPVVMPVFAV